MKTENHTHILLDKRDVEQAAINGGLRVELPPQVSTPIATTRAPATGSRPTAVSSDRTNPAYPRAHRSNRWHDSDRVGSEWCVMCSRTWPAINTGRPLRAGSKPDIQRAMEAIPSCAPRSPRQIQSASACSAIASTFRVASCRSIFPMTLQSGALSRIHAASRPSFMNENA